jgi:hypothetical protein
MDFLIQWLCCLVAFVAGSAAAWGIVTRVIKPAAKVSTDASASAETGPVG